MDAATPRAHSTLLSAMPRKRGPPPSLRITTPSQNPDLLPVPSESSASASVSTLSSATSDTDSFIFPPSAPKPRSLRNMKKLSLTLPSAQSSTTSLDPPADSGAFRPSQHIAPAAADKRRLSVISLPNPSIAPLLTRKGEDGDDSQTAPYADGPVEILPGVWLGSEDNARDWRGLVERGIRSILNVAKEVISTLDATPAPLRPSASVPDLNDAASNYDSTYFSAHVASGRPSLYYLKLPWSHGQSDLVREGFPAAMAFVDKAIARGDGVLIHCQCGVSRSATLAIALVMRAAALRSPHVPPVVWSLKGMQAAYNFTKEKSQWVGPNMSLIYQLMDYERSLSGDISPGTSEQSGAEEEWGRRRSMLEETDIDTDRESMEAINEAKALDQAMVDRIIARKSSVSSMSSTNSNRGFKPSRRPRYTSTSRKRTPSVCSVATMGSVLSEDLVEEDEEEELLGVGGGFDASSVEAGCSSAGSSEPPEDDVSSASRSDHRSIAPSKTVSVSLAAPRAPVRMPPSAPAHRSTFKLPPPPATATRATFDETPRPPSKMKLRRRPPPLGLLPPVPPSPVTPVNDPPMIAVQPMPPRIRRESRRPEMPPAHMRSPPKAQIRPRPLSSILPTPTETLFVFPPSPTLTTCTPSTMTLTSKSTLPFPAVSTPRVSTFKTDGRRRSFIGVGAPATPTTASSRVDVRGWIGMK